MVERVCGAVAAFSLLIGCSQQDEADPSPNLVVSTELGMRWDLVPHRVSIAELAFEPDRDGAGGAITVENAGGPFGAIDVLRSRQSFVRHSGSALRAMRLSVRVEIPATGTTDPEDFVATGEARAGGSRFNGSDTLVAWIAGYRISTNDYDAPPSFATDPVLPYDPGDGFTTQGVGISLGSPVRDGADVVVPVTVRNSLGPGDREDMNAAIPQARSWVRVDLLVVGVVGAPSVSTRAAVEYTLSTAEYGQNTVHEHAPQELQEVTLAGQPALRSALFGISAFDVWLNAAGRIDPACTVTNDPVNFLGKPISGPGRYLTELSVRQWDERYEPADGTGRARVDLFFSNSSTVKEIGNVCLGVLGEVTMLQTSAAVTTTRFAPVSLEVPRGDPLVERVRFTRE